MPFSSKAQMKKFFSMEKRGELKKGTSERWAHETKNIKSLPMRISSKKKNGRSTVKSKMAKYANGGNVDGNKGKKAPSSYQPGGKHYEAGKNPGERYYEKPVEDTASITDTVSAGSNQKIPDVNPGPKRPGAILAEKYAATYKAKMASKAQKKKDGGEVEGEGTETSDSNEAVIKKGSFIIPAGIRNKLKNLLNSGKKANMNQSGGVPVMLSKGEEVVDPDEAKEIDDQFKKNGVKKGISMLAPKAKRKFNVKQFKKK